MRKRLTNIESPRADWRQYQADLKRQAARRRLKKRLPWGVIIAVLLVAGGAMLAVVSTDIAAFWDTQLMAVVNPAAAQSKLRPEDIPRGHIAEILSSNGLLNPTDKEFNTQWQGQSLRVATSLDPELQSFILDSLDTKHALEIAIVVMEPQSGRILALISHSKTDADANVCLTSTFPAASIFKIVTAAAAIETRQMSGHSKLYYNGRRHTLYKSQLKDKRNRYTHQTTLRESFAHSINPVFGKLGANMLGGETLLRYAQAFGFNRSIQFDLPTAASRFNTSEIPYEWAEMASGFNRKTMLLPLHGAMIAAALINKGMMMAPAVVDRIVDDQHHIRYRH